MPRTTTHDAAAYAEAARRLSTGESKASIARATGIPRTTVNDIAARIAAGRPVHAGTSPRRSEPALPGLFAAETPPTPRNEAQKALATGATRARVRHTKGGVSVVVESDTPIRTLEELRAAAQLEGDDWAVARVFPNAWPALGPGGQVVQMHQIKAELRPRAGAELVDFRALGQELLADIRREVKPRHRSAGSIVRPAGYNRGERGILAISTSGEPHLGKLAWGEETGEDYDLDIACERTEAAHRMLLAYNGALNPTRNRLLVGDDFFNIDNPNNTTTAGTPQDVDTRYRKIFRRGVRLMRTLVEMHLEVAPVDVIIKPGNHDTYSCFTAGEVVAAAFEGHKWVTVTNDPTTRSYTRWGTNLIGLAHGSEEKAGDLPLIMAGERKQDWAECESYEWLLAHWHTKRTKHKPLPSSRKLETEEDEATGVQLRWLTSLSGTDAWHHRKGYIKNQKAAESLLYHFDAGHVGGFSAKPVLAGVSR